ncbi:Telo2 [Scenedesmus sp. PABB004]|nr:Telo2 [Scenedesmus sp. PABB004]
MSAPADAACDWAAARAVGGAVAACRSALAAAAAPGDALAPLSRVHGLFIAGDAHAQEDAAAANEQGAQALAAHAAAAGWPALRRAFFAHQFAAWADAVLTVAAGELLPRAHGADAAVLRGAIAATFDDAPPHLALAALVGHLSAVLPKQPRGGGAAASARVTAVGAELAAELLAERFAAPSSAGVAQLLASCRGRAGAEQQDQGQAPPWGFLGPLSQEQAEEAAAQLAAATDRAQQLPGAPDVLLPGSYVPHVLQQAVGCIATHGSSDGAAVVLAALLLQKLVMRGHARAAAGAVLRLAAERGAALAALQRVLLALAEQAGPSEKLLVQLLRQAAAPPAQQPGGELGALDALLRPLLAAHAGLRAVALERLLLCRTLPAPALAALLGALRGAAPSLLPEAAAALARAWCDQGTIHHTPVQQQAYMTAALVSCIQQLPRQLLDPATTPEAAAAAVAAATAAGPAPDAPLPAGGGRYAGPAPAALAGLLPAILQGVSGRLASPSPAIRAQAMRVGRAFAAKLDPAKPLFDDAGDLALMPEEVWPGALHGAAEAGAAARAAAEAQAAAQAPPAGGGDAGAQEEEEEASGRFEALRRLHEAAREPDSDDEEGWGAAAAGPGPAAPVGAVGGAAAAAGAGDDAASDAGSEGSASSLVAFDLREDAAAEAWWGADGLGPRAGTPASLRGLAAALRKHDDMAAALEALARVEVLVRAEPDELAVVGPELARALLHCKVPVWAAGAESAPPPPPEPAGAPGSRDAPPAVPGLSGNAEVQRGRALAAVLSLAPLTAGDTMIAELYSPHLDQYQRVLILDALAAAAMEMSDPRRAPRLAAGSPGAAPALLPPAGARRAAAPPPRALAGGAPGGASPAGEGGVEGEPAGAGGGAAAAPGLVAARSRVWGKVSLAKQQEQAAAGGAGAGAARTFRNRFAPVAVRWASALLKECDVRHHGIDLFGRDALLLGRLLTVLGTFVEAAGETPAAVPLAAGLLEVLRAGEVSGHKEVFVRRAVLVAASQVVRHLPPARLAGAMVGRESDATDRVLVERLQWLLGWARATAAGDADEHCRLLAAGCVAWQVELSEGAMAALEHMPALEGPSLAAPPRAGRGAQAPRRGGAGRELEVRVPSLQERLVLRRPPPARPRCPALRHAAAVGMGKKAAAARAKQRQRLEAWLDDYAAVSAAVEAHLGGGDLGDLLEAGGGLVKLRNFLPTWVAHGLVELLQDLPDDAWNLTAAGDDYARNDVAHHFLSTKAAQLEPAFRSLTLLAPDALFTFSAAKYERGGAIVPHDDRAYTQVRMEDGSVERCSRSVAVIYYLTLGWAPELGGALVDLEAPGGRRVYTPEFNSAIVFEIPRWHEVTPVTADRPRYSLFGWFLEPGELYNLNVGQPPERRAGAEAAELPQPEQQPQAEQLLQELAEAAKKKKKTKRRPVDAGQQELGAAAQQLAQQQEQPQPGGQQGSKKHQRKQAPPGLHGVAGGGVAKGKKEAKAKAGGGGVLAAKQQQQHKKKKKHKQQLPGGGV